MQICDVEFWIKMVLYLISFNSFVHDKYKKRGNCFIKNRFAF
jgi:hypothetical protein